MSRSKFFVAGALVLAAGSGACALITGIGDYAECTGTCDASTRPGDGGVLDARVPPADGGPDDQDADAAAPADDGGEPGDAGQDPGDTGVVADAGDAGPPVNDSGPTCPPPTDIDGGLLVYYPLEGDTNDHSGNGNNGSATVGTDITYGAGKVGGGVTINSAGRGITVSGAAMLGASRTLCAWVNAATGTTGGGLPIIAAGPTGAADFYDLSAANPNAVCPNPVANTLFIDHWGAPCARSNRAVTPGGWSLVCFAQNASSTVFFVNGATSTLSTSVYTSALSTFTIGSDRVAGSTTQVVFRGQLDEISIWSATLSTGDMNAIYSSGNGCFLR